MEELIAPASKLLSYRVLDTKDELILGFETAYESLKTLIADLSEQEITSTLLAKVSKLGQEQEDVNYGLLCGIVTEPGSASELYHLLTLVCQDGMAVAIQTMERLIMEKYHRLLETPKKQVMWLANEMIRVEVRGAERLVYAFLKQIKGGDTTTDNIWLVESVLHLLLDYKPWLLVQPPLIASVLYTFLTLIPEHSSSSLKTLRQEEINLCVMLLRERFSDCISIGRELIRLLQNVARVPEFTSIWKDLLHDPQALSPDFKGVEQLLATRTSRRFISSRLTADVEITLQFIALQVKFGMQKRYQEWFQKKYLNQSSAQHFIPDLIRYLCCVVHPPNEVLCSDVIPRWALIGWLLSLCQSTVAAANARLALFFDYLGYNTEDQNLIMNVEPGILVIFNSLRSHPLMSASLLDFLCRLVPNYCPNSEQFVRARVNAALQDVVQKGVLQSLTPVFESEKLSLDLRALIRKTFPSFCSPEPERVTEAPEAAVSSSQAIFLDEDVEGEDPEVSATLADKGEGAPSVEIVEAHTGEEDEEEWKEGEGEREGLCLDDNEGGEESVEEMEEGTVSDTPTWNEQWDNLDLHPKMKKKFKSLKNAAVDGNDSSTLCHCLGEFLDTMMEVIRSDDTVQQLAAPLWYITRADFKAGCSGSSDNDEEEDTEMDSPQRPFHVLFSRVAEGNFMASLIAQLSKWQPRVGYFFLYYLACFGKKQNVFESKMEPYREYASALYKDEENPTVTALLRDSQEFTSEEPDAFYSLAPTICQELFEESVGHVDFVQLVVSSCNPKHLHLLLSHLMMGNCRLFGADHERVMTILKASLEWDTFEQYCVWQMLTAEGPDPLSVTPLLSHISATGLAATLLQVLEASADHSEASTGILLLLRGASPSAEVIQDVVQGVVTPTATAILAHWIRVDLPASQTALTQLLNAQNSSITSQVVAHLEAVKAKAVNCGVTGLIKQLELDCHDS